MKKRRIVTLLTALALVLSMAPITALAAGSPPTGYMYWDNGWDTDTIPTPPTCGTHYKPRQ